jgi:hypothetical protein
MKKVTKPNPREIKNCLTVSNWLKPNGLKMNRNMKIKRPKAAR